MPNPDNLYELFAAVAARWAQHTAVEVQRRDTVEWWTYADLLRMANVAAAGLSAEGLDAGQRCALLADNDAHWCAAYLGIARLGGVAVPLDTAYKGSQLATLLADSGARLIVTTPEYLPIVRDALAARANGCKVVMLRGEAHGVPAFEAWLQQANSREAAIPTGFPPGTEAGRSWSVETSPARPSDAAVILYTSGTTSDPKGVVLTHGNLLAERTAVFQVVRLDERDCVLSVLPLFHALAQIANLLLPFSVGARVVFLETVNTTELLRALRERGVTAFCCVPQFFYLIHQRVMHEVAAGGGVKRRVFTLLLRINGVLRDRVGLNAGRTVFGRVHAVLGPHMRLLVTGGSRFDPAIGRDLHSLGFDILQAYGLTECSGAAVMTRPGDRRTTSVGHPLPGVEVKILPAASDSPDTAGGEIAIRGPVVMDGYFNRPDATAATLRDGWLYTGDLGSLDADGRVYVTGRSKEVIVLSSGKNIYPEEIEAHYQQSPFIKELCVLGLEREDAPSAERLYAVIVPDRAVMQERKIVNVGELLRFEIEGLSVKLPNHKRILGYEIATEDLPRTTTRKLKRFEIERRVRARGAAAARRETGTLSEDDRLWAADPDVARILATIRAASRVDAVSPDANLELDLGLDSMERVELLAELEHQSAVRVPEEIAQRIYTVRELVDAVHSRAGAPAGGEAGVDPWARLLAQAPEANEALTGLLERKAALAAFMFVIATMVGWLARLLAGLRVRGVENLPRSGPYLLCPNHQSYLDPFLLVGVLPFRAFRDLFFVGASEYFETPLMRAVARSINVVPVDPDANLVRAMQAGAFGLTHGKVLILFPEGERSIDGTVKKFKKGAPILSRYLAVPIVPVAIDGVFDIWPRNRPIRWTALMPWSRTRVRISFGAPILAAQAVVAVAVPAASHVGPVAVLAADHVPAADQLREVVVRMWDKLREERQWMRT